MSNADDRNSSPAPNEGVPAEHGFQTKEEYTAALFEELTSTELALLNLTIYYNPRHVRYYEMFACGEYKWCWDYLMEHRHLMTLENVPEDRREQAHAFIVGMKKMRGESDE